MWKLTVIADENQSPMRKKFSIIFTFLTLGCLLLSVGFVWWYWRNQPVCRQQEQCPEKRVMVQKGTSLQEIALFLKKDGLIQDSFIFRLQVVINGFGKKIQAGEFFISPSESPLEIARKMTKGSFDKRLTFLEGWRAEEIGEYLTKQGLNINLNEWRNLVEKENLEGRLFPDTYYIKSDISIRKLVELLLNNFNRKFSQDLVEDAAKKGLDRQTVVILASLVEREAAGEKDRPIVAGILLKRLTKGWPLQIDATVQYAIANLECKTQNAKCDWWPKKITEIDLQINSPYNTYLHQGLPPGPICNPSISAIKAVIYSQDSLYWFYLSDENGKMYYGRTVTEQAENVKKYLNKVSP